MKRVENDITTIREFVNTKMAEVKDAAGKAHDLEYYKAIRIHFNLLVITALIGYELEKKDKGYKLTWGSWCWKALPNRVQLHEIVELIELYVQNVESVYFKQNLSVPAAEDMECVHPANPTVLGTFESVNKKAFISYVVGALPQYLQVKDFMRVAAAAEKMRKRARWQFWGVTGAIALAVVGGIVIMNWNSDEDSGGTEDMDDDYLDVTIDDDDSDVTIDDDEPLIVSIEDE